MFVFEIIQVKWPFRDIAMLPWDLSAFTCKRGFHFCNAPLRPGFHPHPHGTLGAFTFQMFYFKIDEEDDISLNEDPTNYEDKDECSSPLNIDYGSYP